MNYEILKYLSSIHIPMAKSTGSVKYPQGIGKSDFLQTPFNKTPLENAPSVSVGKMLETC